MERELNRAKIILSEKDIYQKGLGTKARKDFSSFNLYTSRRLHSVKFKQVGHCHLLHEIYSIRQYLLRHAIIAEALNTIYVTHES